MKSGGEGCRGVFTVPAIVADHAKRNSQLKKEIESFCKVGDGRTCLLPSSNGAGDLTPQGADFCGFQNRIGKLESKLNALRASNVRWAETAQQVWQEEAKRFGTIQTVTTQHHSSSSLGEMDVSFDVPEYSTRIFLDVAVRELATEEKPSRQFLDSGFSLCFDSPGQAMDWYGKNFSALPSIFSSCASRLDFVNLRRNRFVDDLFHCWQQSASARGLQGTGFAWNAALHPMSQPVQ